MEQPSLPVDDQPEVVPDLGALAAQDLASVEPPFLAGRKLGLIQDESEILFAIPNVISPAYVLFDHNYQVARTTILDWLGQAGVISMGRYGRWQYNAMEDALIEGREAALLAGKSP